jgi:hypothetical protein
VAKVRQASRTPCEVRTTVFFAVLSEIALLIVRLDVLGHHSNSPVYFKKLASVYVPQYV